MPTAITDTIPAAMPTVPINFMAVFIAALASVAIGALWYGPLFGAKWKAMMGFTDESMKKMKMTPMTAMILGLVSSIVMAFVLQHSLVFGASYLHISGTAAGLQAALWNWLGFIAPITLGAVLWEGRSWNLWILNASYWLVATCAMGVILANMPA